MRCDIHALSEVQRLEALRILLVGSSKRTQHAAVELSRLGHSVLEAPDVADATHALMVQRFDAVVLVTARQQNETLWRGLQTAEFPVYRIGDCLAPGTTADSVFSGHRLAREIDSPDPRVPLPLLKRKAL